MAEVNMIGFDLAKNVFQGHGATASGAVILRKKLHSSQALGFLAGRSRLLQGRHPGLRQRPLLGP